MSNMNSLINEVEKSMDTIKENMDEIKKMDELLNEIDKEIEEKQKQLAHENKLIETMNVVKDLMDEILIIVNNISDYGYSFDMNSILLNDGYDLDSLEKNHEVLKKVRDDATSMWRSIIS